MNCKLQVDKLNKTGTNLHYYCGECMTGIRTKPLRLYYKFAFVLLQKLREAMAEEMNGRVVCGEGKEAAIDGGCSAAT
jgi:hypothetical protein